MPRWIWEQRDWPAFCWDESEVGGFLVRARQAQGKILGAASLLDPEMEQEALVQVLTEDGVQTSAIEGEKLDPQAVRSSIARKLGLDAAGLPRPSRAVDGLVEVLLDATRRYDGRLTLRRLCGWQAALFPSGYSGMRPVVTGKLRGKEPMQVVSGALGRERVHFVAPPRQRLDRDLARFLEWFEAASPEPPEQSGDGLVRAGLAHLWFVTLHPFEDGNGRLARAITDMAIARDERRPVRLFSLSAQMMKERSSYYEVLERTGKGSLDVTRWLVWFLDQCAAACLDAHSVVGRTLGKARFWLRHAGTELNQRQRKALNRLLEAGPAGFEGGMTNAKYTRLTRASRATASRDLADLVAQGCLVAQGTGGRGSRYEIDWTSLGPNAGQGQSG